VKRALAKGALIVGGSRFIINVIAVFANVILARLLTPSDFGLVAIASTISTLVISLTELPISSLLLQLDTITASHYDTAWTVSLIRSLLLSLVICALAVPVGHFYADERLVPVMLVIGAGALFGGFSSPRMVDFQKQLRFDVENKILVIQRIVGVTASVVLAYATRSYWALLAGTLFSDFVGTALSLIYAWHRPRLCFYELKFFLRQGAWLSLTQAIVSLSGRADPLIVGYFANSAVLGQFTVGQRFASIPTRETIAPMTQTLLPSFALLRGEPAQLCVAYKKAQAVLFAIAFPAGAGMSILSSFVVYRFLGEQWSECIAVMQVFAVLFALHALGTLSHQLALALGENRLLTGRNLLMALVRIPAVGIGMALAGMSGCLVGLSVAVVVGLYINMLIVQRMIGLTVLQQLGASFNTIVSTVAMTGSVSLVTKILPVGSPSEVSFAVVAVFTGALTYLCARAVCALLSPERAILENELVVLYKRFRSNR
jgi:lipopolysaccharide exporter